MGLRAPGPPPEKMLGVGARGRRWLELRRRKLRHPHDLLVPPRVDSEMTSHKLSQAKIVLCKGLFTSGGVYAP